MGKSSTKNDKKESKKVKKEKKTKKKSTSSSSTSEVAEDPEDRKQTLAVASTFGLKGKAVQLGKNITRVSDLKVEQLAIILGQCHPTLTSQTLFSLGGELLEVHRKGLASMKRQEDGTERSLTLRIEVSKRMGWSEKRWRDRLVGILSEVANMDNMSVISQHSSLVSLRRSIMDEIKAHETAADAASWLAKVKKMILDYRAKAAEDMKQDHTDSTTRPKSPAKSSRKSRKSKKSKKDKRKKDRIRSKSPSPQSPSHEESSGESSSEDSDRFNGRFKGSRGQDRDRRGSGSKPTPTSDGRSTMLPDDGPASNDEIAVFFDSELKQYLSSVGDRTLFLKVLAAEGFENTAMFLDGVSEGWGPEPSCCSAESKEFLECMSWVGRRSAKKFTDRVQQKLDYYNQVLEGIVPELPAGSFPDESFGDTPDALEAQPIPDATAPAEEKEETGGSPKEGTGDNTEGDTGGEGNTEVVSTMPRLPHIRLPDDS